MTRKNAKRFNRYPTKEEERRHHRRPHGPSHREGRHRHQVEQSHIHHLGEGNRTHHQLNEMNRQHMNRQVKQRYPPNDDIIPCQPSHTSTHHRVRPCTIQITLTMMKKRWIIYPRHPMTTRIAKRSSMWISTVLSRRRNFDVFLFRCSKPSGPVWINNREKSHNRSSIDFCKKNREESLVVHFKLRDKN